MAGGGPHTYNLSAFKIRSREVHSRTLNLNHTGMMSDLSSHAWIPHWNKTCPHFTWLPARVSSNSSITLLDKVSFSFHSYTAGFYSMTNTKTFTGHNKQTQSMDSFENSKFFFKNCPLVAMTKGMNNSDPHPTCD